MRYLFMLFPQYLGLMGQWASSTEAPWSMVITVAGWIVVALIAYLLGSLNSAIIISKSKYKQDIRSFGSGNAGLTNMHRVYGKGGAVLTLVGDIGKQVLSVFIGALLLGRYGAYLAGAGCMIGHILPVYYNFKGGKGVLTAATMILVIDPLIFAILFIIFALVLLITRYVSLASIIAAITYPAVITIVNGNPISDAVVNITEATLDNLGNASQMTGTHVFELFFALFAGALVIFMHRSNLYRLFNGKENKFSFRKKPDAQKVLDAEDPENDSDEVFEQAIKDRENRKKKKKRK